MGFFFNEKVEFAEFVHGLCSGLEAIKADEFISGEVVEGPVRIQNIDHGKVVAQTNFVIGFIVSGGDFENPRAEFEIDGVVANDREQGFDSSGEGAANVQSDQGAIARILRIHRYGSISHDRFRAGRCDFKKGPGLFNNLDFVMVKKSALTFRNHFLIAERSEGNGAPVHHALAAVDEAFLMEIDKNLLHTTCIGFIHGESLATPIAGTTELFKLVDNDATVFLLPLPDTLQELFAPKVVAGLLFFLAKAAFDDGLSGDTGMVCTWKPEDFVSGLARAAGQNVLQCVIENMPERENSSNIGRRDDYGESRFGRGGISLEEALIQPPSIPFIFD